MGCLCSTPKVAEQGRSKEHNHNSAARAELPGRPRSILSPRRRRSTQPSSSSLSVLEVLELAQDVVRESFQGSVDPLTVAAIALIESSGNAKEVRWEEDSPEARHGLCLMLYSTAKWLMSQGYSKHPASSPASLHSPKTALYFAAAYLKHLSEDSSNGKQKTEEWVVRSYHGGGEHSQDPSSTDKYWRKYRQARQQLQRLHWAMEGEDSESSDGPLMHVVQGGETLSTIAKVCGTTVSGILEANPEIKDISGIRAGDCIEIPVKHVLPRLYVVQSGDTVASIARRHDVSLTRLLRANSDIKCLSPIQPGWVVSIPGLRGTSCEQVDILDRSELISAAVDEGPSFLAAMVGKYGISLDDGILGDGIGIQCTYGHSGISRLKRFHTTPAALRIGDESPRM